MPNRPPIHLPADLPEPPLRKAVRYADLGLSDRLDNDALRWLHQNPILWLMALTQIRQDIEERIDKASNELRALTPDPGGKPSNTYLRRRREIAEQNIGRLHVLGIARRQADEVKTLIAPTRAADLTPPADLVAGMLTIVRMCRNGASPNIIQQAAERYLDAWTTPVTLTAATR